MTDHWGDGPVMPFLPVTSKGGPYNDDAFVAGYQTGAIASLLEHANQHDHPRIELTTPFYANLIPQVELFAMQTGYTMHPETLDHGWAMATFTRTPPIPEVVYVDNLTITPNPPPAPGVRSLFLETFEQMVCLVCGNMHDPTIRCPCHNPPTTT